jgi:Flp pilus assembly CpaF family ATPase
MTQGNEGSMSTVHARSSVDVFSRLALYAAMTEERIPFEASAALVAAAVDLVVFVSRRRSDGPADSPGAVTSVREITGREGSQVTSNEVLRLDTDGRILSVASFRPETVERLRDAGFDPARLGEGDRW